MTDADNHARAASRKSGPVRGGSREAGLVAHDPDSCPMSPGSGEKAIEAGVARRRGDRHSVDFGLKPLPLPLAVGQLTHAIAHVAFAHFCKARVKQSQTTRRRQEQRAVIDDRVVEIDPNPEGHWYEITALGARRLALHVRIGRTTRARDS